jgi:hypothetical protein
MIGTLETGDFMSQPVYWDPVEKSIDCVFSSRFWQCHAKIRFSLTMSHGLLNWLRTSFQILGILISSSPLRRAERSIPYNPTVSIFYIIKCRM